jgi:hypothetical protein
MTNIFWLLLILPGFLIARTCPLDPWEADLEITYKSYQTSHFWNKTGSRKSAHNEFDKKEIEIYGEFGLTSCDTLTLKESWGRAEERMNGRTFGFSDMELGWRRFLWTNGSHVIASRALAIIPIQNNFEPAIRYGQYGGEVDILWGYCCYDFLLGYRFYEGFPSDQIRACAQMHWELCSWITFKGEAKLEYGVFNGQNRPDASLFLYQPNYRLFKVKAEAEIKLCRCVSTNVGWFQHVWGENVGTGGGFYGGIDIHF